jgi:hypothetical protein
MSNIYVDRLDAILAAIQAQQGNPLGGTAEADSAILAGQPVYVLASGHIDLALADAMPQAGVAGLATAAAAATFAASYALGPLGLADWSAVAGTQYLVPGAIYYLSTTVAGTITTIAPAAGYLVVIGRALSPSQLHAYQEPIILL